MLLGISLINNAKKDSKEMASALMENPENVNKYGKH